MSVQVEKLEHHMAKLTIEVEAQQFEQALQGAYNKQKKNFRVPGFRTGKVPRQMIEKMYGPEIFYEDAANSLISKQYAKVYEESDLEIVSRPKIDIVQVEKGKPFVFTAEVAVKPDVKLGEYKGLEVEKQNTEVTDEDIEKKIKEEQVKNARTVEVTDRAVRDTDEITLNFEGFVDGEAFEGGKGENFPLTIGSGSFIPGFEDQLIGAEINKELDVNVTFPENYQAKNLAGKKALFKCLVTAIKGKDLPEINDEFASEVSEFDTLDEYKADIRKKVTEQKKADARRKVEDQAVEKAVENATIDIPEAMIETEAQQLADNFSQRIAQQGLTMEQYFEYTGLTQEKMMEDLRPQAVKKIRTRLVMEAVVDAENIQVSDEKMDEEFGKMAKQYGMEADKLKEYMGDDEKKQMRKDIAVQNAVTLVADAAVEK